MTARLAARSPLPAVLKVARSPRESELDGSLHTTKSTLSERISNGCRLMTAGGAAAFESPAGVRLVTPRSQQDDEHWRRREAAMAGTNYMQLARETPPNSRGQAMSGAQLAAYQRDVKQGAAGATAHAMSGLHRMDRTMQELAHNRRQCTRAVDSDTEQIAELQLRQHELQRGVRASAVARDSASQARHAHAAVQQTAAELRALIDQSRSAGRRLKGYSPHVKERGSRASTPSPTRGGASPSPRTSRQNSISPVHARERIISLRSPVTCARQ